MRKIIVISVLAVLLAGLVPVNAHHDFPDEYTSISIGPEMLYIDDDPYPYIYLECNAIEGMQRGEDGNQDGHHDHPFPDCLIF